MQEEARRLKDKGNRCFREKRYNKAVQLYTDSLEKYVDPIVLGNRAQGYLSLGHYDHALMDCNKALELDPNLVKALFRRSVALEAVGLNQQAKRDLERLLKISDDAAARAALTRLEKKRDLPCIEVKTCEKGDEIRSERPFVDVSIEFDGPEESQSSAATEAAAPVLPNKSFSPSATYSDFLVDFSLLRDFPLQFAQYFMEINVKSYHSLFDDMLDAEVVSCLLKGLSLGLDAKNPSISPEKVAKTLLFLSEVERFDMIPLFMGVEDKKNLQRICDSLPKLDAAAVSDRYS